jgi:hypothetical protein
LYFDCQNKVIGNEGEEKIMKLSKKLCITAKKSFSLVLALTLMLSICAVSGMSLNVFAATSSGQKIYINLNKNKEWNGFSSVTCRFADDDGMVLDTGTVSKNSSGVFEATAPSGATKIELSSGVKFTLPDKTVAKDFRRIYLYNSNNTYNEAYAYSWVNDTDFNAEWPGVAMTKTSSGSDYYYVDVKSSHKNVIFSNKGETQTSDLGINDSYSADNALYDASKSQWTNPFIKTIDISAATGDTEFYLTTDGSFKVNTFLLNLPTNSQRQHIKQFMFQTMTGCRFQRFMQLLTTTMPMKEQLSLQKTP